MERRVMESKYLVRIDAENFFTALRGGEVYGSPFPSYGAAMSYRVAFEVCRRIRLSGYVEAVVTNELGRPVTSMDVMNAMPVSEERCGSSTTTNPSPEDWQLMAAVSSGEKPAAIAREIES